MTTYPKPRLVLPNDLTGASNGRIPLSLLIPVEGGGSLHWLCAWHWMTLVGHAKQDGISLTYSPGGTYRTFSQQERLFFQRFTPGYVKGRVNKLYNGKWYTLRPGMAQAAVPGTSNHGYGLAIDVALGAQPTQAQALTQDAINWLLWVAPHHGFGWELDSEPWHIRYYRGS